MAAAQIHGLVRSFDWVTTSVMRGHTLSPRERDTHTWSGDHDLVAITPTFIKVAQHPPSTRVRYP